MRTSLFPLVLLCLLCVAAVIPVRYNNVTGILVDPATLTAENVFIDSDSHGAMGSTETFDVSASGDHTGTLDANCTGAFSNWPPTGTLGRITLVLTQNGTGGWTWTSPVSVITTPPPVVNPAPNSATHLTFESSDGGASIYGWSDFGEVGSISFSVDGVGSVIATGTQKANVQIPYACLITGVTVRSNVSSNTTIDIWKKVYTPGWTPPTIANTIVASAKPTLTAAIDSQDTTLTGWTKTVSADDVFYFTVDTNSAATHLDIVLHTIR